MDGCKSAFIGLMLLLLSGGCTNHQLRVSTTHQAKTLTETHYEQVLNNIAMYCIDPMALPSMVSLKSGSTQIGDTGTLGFLGIAGIDTKFGSSPTISASRSIVDQWGTAPITDDNVLKVLRMAYRTARGSPSFLGEKDANDIGHDLSQQVGTNADISTDADTVKELARIIGEARPRNIFEMFRKGDVESQDVRMRVSSTLNSIDDSITNTLDEKFLLIDNQHGALEDQPIGPTNPPRFKIAFEEALPSSGLTKETARRINDIQEELANIANLGNNWYHFGCVREVPSNACFVGHYKGCGRPCKHWRCGDECYVWVCPDGRGRLADFTLSILKLSTVFQETQIVTVPSGIQYSPAFSRPAGGR